MSTKLLQKLTGTDGQTDRQAGRQTDRQTYVLGGCTSKNNHKLYSINHFQCILLHFRISVDKIYKFLNNYDFNFVMKDKIR